MSPEIASTLRALLLTLGGALVGKGLVDEGTLQMIVGGIVGVATLVWALYSKKACSGEAQKTAAKVNAQNGYARFYFLLAVYLLGMIALVTIKGCAFVGLPTPDTSGQQIVQAYGNANAVSAMIPGLLKGGKITSSQGQDALDASRAVRGPIEVYWESFGAFEQCKLASATPNDQAPKICAGPNGFALINSINVSVIQVLTFMTRHQGEAK